MKSPILVILLLFLSQCLWGQYLSQPGKVSFEGKQNIEIHKVYSDSLVSVFVISIKDSVPNHTHAKHCEQVYVLEGRGKMFLDGKFMKVKKGDWISIPANVPHGVKVVSRKPLKVVSVQSPEFLGPDRIPWNQ